MNTLYLWLDLLSLSVPLLVSFHPRLKLHKQMLPLLKAIVITMIPFIIWDVYFTVQGYWGFNPVYLIGIDLLHLPVEEWLFFICIPYACVFTHYAILELNPKLRYGEIASQAVFVTLVMLLLIGLTAFWDKAYTRFDFLFALLVLVVVRWKKPSLLEGFFVTFIFMLIPFFLVNGVLTGSWITDQIVWYNDSENMGIRMGTIPVEDSIYALSMILMNLFLFERFQSQFST